MPLLKGTFRPATKVARSRTNSTSDGERSRSNSISDLDASKPVSIGKFKNIYLNFKLNYIACKRGHCINAWTTKNLGAGVQRDI